MVGNFPPLVGNGGKWWEMVGNGGKFPTTGGKWWEIFGGHISHQAIFPLDDLKKTS